MWVEVLGLPGSGKSSIIKRIVPPLKKRGCKLRTGKAISALPAIGNDVPRFVMGQADREMLYRAARFACTHSKVVDHVDRRLTLTPRDRFLFSLTTIFHEAFEEYRDQLQFALVDEGFIHRGAEAHLTQTDPLLYKDYLDAIPVPDMIVYMRLGSRMAFRRSNKRRADKDARRAKVEAKLGGIETFEMRRTLIEIGLARAVERGAKLIEVDATKPLDDCTHQVLPHLLEAVTPSKRAERRAAG